MLRIAFLLAGLAVAEDALAGPSISISWDGYPGPINRSRSAGSPVTVVVTALGFDRPVKGINVRLALSSGFGALPDAWRFDAAGCAAGGFSTPETAAGQAYPRLTGAHEVRFSGVQYEYGGGWYQYANLHDPAPVNLATRYTIAKFEFTLDAVFEGAGTRPDSCGCVEQPLCLYLTDATWLTDEDLEIPFVRAQDILNWEDPTNSLHCPYGCDLCNEPPPVPPNPCLDTPTATLPRTWGSLKGSYR